MTIQSCGTCNAGHFQGPNGQGGICRAHPPTACVVLIPRGAVQMELVPTPISSFAQVPREGWCREWAAIEFDWKGKQ